MREYIFYDMEAARDVSSALGIPRNTHYSVVCSSDDFAKVKLLARRVVKGKEQWVPVDAATHLRTTIKIKDEIALLTAA